MVAYIRDVVVIKKQWLCGNSFEDGVALCQSIPGATAMQMAGYCGYRAGGLLGAVSAYVAFGLPAFLLMLGFSAIYSKVQDFHITASIFAGLRAIVVAIVANATVNFGRTSLKNTRDIILALAVAAFLGFGGHPIVAVAVATISALILYREWNPIPGPHHGIGRLAQKGVPKSAAFILATVLGFGLVMTVLFLADTTLFNLAAIMVKIDVFAFGGGFASTPLMFHEIVDTRHWLEGRTFMDGIALGQVTPGPIVITATFVGYQVAGSLGAVVATLGIFTPSFFILILTIPHFDRLQRSPLFRRALRGALMCFVGLLLAVTVKFAIAVPWSIPTVLMASLVLIALRLKVNILWVVLAGALVSIIAL
jgi:chromate transporter